MKNIGPVSRKWLAEIGILTLADLEQIGSIRAYKMIHERYPKKASLNLLWALEAAVQNISWLEIGEEEKEELRRQLKS